MTAVAQELDVEGLRQDFPILQAPLPNGARLAYLDNASSTQRPRQVIAALDELYGRHYANVHRGIHALSEQATDLYEASREAVRGLLNAPTAEEIIFTRGTTESINLVARSWGDACVGPGDEIVLSEMEHHSNLVPWQQLAQRRGCSLKFIPVTDDGQLDLNRYAELLSSRTKLVAVTAVSNVLGTVNPVAQIVRLAHDCGALALVDGAQSAPHQPTDVQRLGCDFFAFSGHKMLGPSGAGALFGRREILEAMPPFLGGGSMIRRVRLDGFEPADVPARFEAGTPPIGPVIGLKPAIDYLQAVGLEAIERHERELTRQAHRRLGEIAGVRLLGPAVEHKAGIVCFVIDGIHAHDVAQLLDRHGVAVRAGHHCAMPLHQRLGVAATARASFYLYNTSAEVDTLAEAILAAQHTFRRR